MLLYKDIITGDEMFSDAFPVKLVDDLFYEVECAMVTFKEGQVDIGANPSAEETEEGVDDGAQTVNNVVHSFRLQPDTSFDKKGYISHLKPYLKTIKDKIISEEGGLSKEEQATNKRLTTFEKGAQAFVKAQISNDENFKEWEFYVGESMEDGGMVALLNFREDGITPYFIFWKEGLKVEKL